MPTPKLMKDLIALLRMYGALDTEFRVEPGSELETLASQRLYEIIRNGTNLIVDFKKSNLKPNYYSVRDQMKELAEMIKNYKV